MVKTKWLIAIPLAVLLSGATARASAIRDEARMFRPQVVEEARRHLDRLERSTSIPVVIETISHLPGVDRETPSKEKVKAVNEAARRRDAEIHDEGIYILISKADKVISAPLVRERLERFLPRGKRDAIRDAFLEGFKKEDYDQGLKNGVIAIERSLEGVRVENARGGGRAAGPVPIGPGGHRAPARGGGSFLGTFLMIGLGILAVLIVLRLLGGLFGRSARGGYPGGMGGPRAGYGPGYGPGYGGGGGGGFFSGLLGGLGGAMAGNWLYDQMSGRHGGMTSAGTGYPTEESAGTYPDQGGDAIVGGEGGSWGDGGEDTGGGDWGGGDAGGDWGGGGGDWGGGDGGGGGDW